MWYHMIPPEVEAPACLEAKMFRKSDLWKKSFKPNKQIKQSSRLGWVQVRAAAHTLLIRPRLSGVSLGSAKSSRVSSCCSAERIDPSSASSAGGAFEAEAIVSKTLQFLHTVTTHQRK